MTLRLYAILAAMSVSLTGCITASDLPLSKNVWQVQTESGGAFFTGMTSNYTLKHAAELTLKQGYTHFALVNPSTQQGSVYVGSIPGRAETNVNFVGNSGFATTTYTPEVPIMAPQKNVTVTVVMYNAGDPQAANALDAAAIMKQFSS